MIPILIGLAAASYVFYNSITEVHFERVEQGNYQVVESLSLDEIDVKNPDHFQEVEEEKGDYDRITYRETLERIDWSYLTAFWILLACICVGIRLYGYVLRLRILTDKTLSWRKCLDVIIIWEFASALTPSVVGGAGFAVWFLYKEGFSAGKSTGIVMITAMLDELFYIIMVPFVFLFLSAELIFPKTWNTEIMGFTFSTTGFFWLGYFFLLILTSLIIYGVFISPRRVKFLLLKFFKLPWLRRWKYNVIKWGDDLIVTSKELKGKPKKYWLTSFGATFLSWTSRYLVVNCLIAALVVVNDHFLIYAKQLCMWIIMLISPTPGSSGLAEIVFAAFFGEDILPVHLAGPLSILWRILTYFLYIFLGVVVFPRWLRRVSKPKIA
ncbi:MAG: lysylphosphatidylglycerol synthase transmembrane domain-containing protein [Bacteroidota bacterium]